jgi:hypothetical protein
MTTAPGIGATRPVDPGGPGRQRWNIMRAAMLPSESSTPRRIAACAFSRPAIGHGQMPVFLGAVVMHVEPERGRRALKCGQMTRRGEHGKELADRVVCGPELPVA